MAALVGSVGTPPCRAGVPRPMSFLCPSVSEKNLKTATDSTPLANPARKA